jgi:DNA repair exonuclease SbcCD nuclease subunit
MDHQKRKRLKQKRGAKKTVRYLLVGDTHLGLYNDSDVWHKVVLDLFKEIHDTCFRENIETIIHLGDFFHNRKSTNTKTQDAANKIAEMIERFNLIIVVGNHDTYYKNKILPTSLSIFKEHKKIQVVHKQLFFPEDIILVPWGAEVQPTHYKYCMGHFEITGFNMNDSYICKKGRDPSDFSSFKRVFSGHFHTPSTQGKITYLGSPFQQTFHDAGSTRGYYIFENGELEFIEFNKYPHFIKMSTESINNSDIKGNIIKLTFEKDYGTVENGNIIENIMSKEPQQMHVDFSKISYELDDEPEEDIPDMIDHEEIIKDYISRIEKPVNIKEKTLLEIISKLTGEIKNE